MGKIIKDGVEYDFGSDIIYHLISSGESGGDFDSDVSTAVHAPEVLFTAHVGDSYPTATYTHEGKDGTLLITCESLGSDGWNPYSSVTSSGNGVAELISSRQSAYTADSVATLLKEDIYKIDVVTGDVLTIKNYYRGIVSIVACEGSEGSSEGDSESNSGIKVVELGALGETFDLTQYEGYENFTLDNFYVQVDSVSTSAGTSTINYWTDSYSRTAYISKAQITGGSASLAELLSYDASTGQLVTINIGKGSVSMTVVSNQDSYDKKTTSPALTTTVTGIVYLIQAVEPGEDSGSGDSTGDSDGDVILGEITEILASGVSNTYTILEDGLYHITSFQGGTYFPIYINDVNQGETVGVNGVVSKTIADGANPVITSLSYLLNLNEGDVVTTTNVNATLAISKIESNVVDGNAVEEEKVLLWENTKPTSSFAAQTVTLSQSIEDFDWVEILVYQSTSLKTKPAVYRYQVEQLMDETFHMNLTNKAAFGFVNRCNSSGHFYSRAIGVTSSTGLFFSAALRRDKNTAFEETTAQLIPYQIYGVKNGVIRAESPELYLSGVINYYCNGANAHNCNWQVYLYNPKSLKLTSEGNDKAGSVGYAYATLPKGKYNISLSNTAVSDAYMKINGETIINKNNETIVTLEDDTDVYFYVSYGGVATDMLAVSIIKLSDLLSTSVTNREYPVELKVNGGGSITAWVNVDGTEVTRLTLPSGTAWGGYGATGTFTPED